ncbi:hypothetical protein QVD17_29020 [Tagetes erecta]|uniref:Uncharacterized protein n=1 Tax=Tagetes erecta TaxID=13708 RepID=A0AAD8NKW0_TARER|nr:hypothetical protein QVD17_29020 [Tagetes erecta]
MFSSPINVIPWVGLYIAVASMICTIAMAADVIQAFWQGKLWFPNRFFTLNAATITLIAITMKLPVDLTTEMPMSEFVNTKILGMCFLVIMLANFLPSLALMDDKELLKTMVALAILMLTIVVNIALQFDNLSLFFGVAIILIFPILWPFSVAITVSATRKKLEHRYKEAQSLVTCNQEKMFSFKEHKGYVKKYWMMAETHNPQFVIACSPVSSAFGVLCLYIAIMAILDFSLNVSNRIPVDYGTSDYKWSIKIIYFLQSIGIVVGSISPIFRCFTSVGHYNLSKKWGMNQINVFRVEKQWIQTLKQLKCCNVHSHIPGRYCKIVFHNIINIFLNLCLTLQIVILVICKTICLIPKTFLIFLSCCWYFVKYCLERFKKIETSNVRIEEYTKYVVQIDEESKLSNRILKNTLHSITQLLNKYEEKEPINLMKLLEKSRGFSGVVNFDNDQVPPLTLEKTHSCWSLVLVSLTSITIALPYFESSHFKGLLDSMSEGLKIVRHIEDCLNVDDDSIKIRRVTRRVWTEVELYRTWLQIKLEKKAREGKTSKEILKWLGEEAAKIVIRFKSSKKPSIDHSSYKFILASSMYRISQTILLQYNEQENLSNDEELLEWILTMIADILTACFTNLPCVIKMKCHHDAIENRGNSIWNAAQLLGTSKKILKMLKSRQLPIMDLDSMAYIDKWRVLTMSQIPSDGPITSGGVFSASPVRIQRGSSSFNESLIVNVM